jgi:hypothetical protein
MAGTRATLNQTQSNGTASQGKWHPTIVYLCILVLAEVTLMGVLRSQTRHGG